MGGLILGALIGAVAGFAYSQSQQLQQVGKKTKKALKKAAEGARLPRPDFRVHLPATPEDYDILDAVICECASQVQAEFPQMQGEQFLITVRNCVLTELYPNFEWPPVPGDHPTVPQLWTIVSYEIGRSATEGTLCVEEPSEDEEEVEENPLRLQFISPPR